MAIKRHKTWFPTEIGGDVLEDVVRATDYDALEARAKELHVALASLVLHTKPAKLNAVALNNALQVLKNEKAENGSTPSTN